MENKITKEQISKNVRGVRDELGLRQREIAELLGINPFTYANYELNRAMPPADTYLRIMALKGREVIRVSASVSLGARTP